MQHPEGHDITALAYGLIEGAERETLLEHLSECDTCRAAYDGYREEQAIVRDTIVRDARSGAAEARALENTLRMLGAEPRESVATSLATEEAASKRGRLFSLPVWLIAAEIAAVMVVAVGLFFLLKPTDETTTPNDNPIASKAPAEVEKGVVYVRDGQGEWKPSEAMPMDEWMMAGDSRPLTFTLDDGSKADLEQGAVFRISMDQGQPFVYLLHGSGEIDASTDFVVRAGEAGFSTGPGARISLRCEVEGFNPSSVQRWSRPELVNAQVLAGDVALRSEQRGFYFVPLRNGEKVEWKRGDFRVLEANGQELMLPMHSMAWATSLEGKLGEDDLEQVHVMLRKQVEVLGPRLDDLRLRLEEARKSNPRHTADIDRQLRELDARMKQFPRFEHAEEAVNDMTIFKLGDEVIVVSSNGYSVSVSVSDATGSVTYEAATPKLVRERLPERLHELFDGIEFETDASGRVRMKGAHAESSSQSGGSAGARIKIVRESESDD